MKILWFVLCLFSAAAVCRADRDIVYAARYYTSLGSHRTSYFHIYRINPDGTGKTQLTFGSCNEYTPKWSANGRQITFLSYDHTAQVKLCEISANGGGRRVLKTLSSSVLLSMPFVPGYRLETIIPDTGDAPAQHVLVNLKTGRKQVLAVPTHDDDNDVLLPMPGYSLVYAANNHNSTVGTDHFFYRLNPDTGALRSLREGQFLAWSPDGSRFCVAPGRDTTPYDKRRQAHLAQGFDQVAEAYRLVWSAPLYVRAAGGGKMQQITPRLSYVTGADWRKEK